MNSEFLCTEIKGSIQISELRKKIPLKLFQISVTVLSIFVTLILRDLLQYSVLFSSIWQKTISPIHDYSQEIDLKCCSSLESFKS